ncbi:hypothetical protein [Kutzneria sp. 744]|uniref:hypothetical protein n=1 Tax=Kutzneria sp. (strain 744) TaxID=345341 RepID=UPI0004B79728|nr:hypothetical protein [Kutzneria sp. 744]
MTSSALTHRCITGNDYLRVGDSLAAIAANIVEEIGELRAGGEFPDRASVSITVRPGESTLHTQIAGLSPTTDPDGVQTRAAILAVFELASHYNVIDLDGAQPPVFVHRILAVDATGTPYTGLIGTGIGDVHPTHTAAAGAVVATAAGVRTLHS